MITDFERVPTPDWTPDVLGDDYQQVRIDLGEDPDGEGQIEAVLVRHRSAEKTSQPQAALWVHGMTDYFFQTHVAEAYVAKDIAFYAIDLRKCGRAWHPGQSAHHVTDMESYFIDLNRALELIKAAGHREVSINAHSTGGLIVALWLDWLRQNPDQQQLPVTAAVLNSPWIDLQFSAWKKPVFHVVSAIMAKVRPSGLLPAGVNTGYGESISAAHFGEWDIDLKMKPIEGHPKKWAWFNAVLKGQRQIARGIEMGVPTLVLHSDRSMLTNAYHPDLHRADAVLDVEQIAQRTPKLGAQARAQEIPGALHDVYLSHTTARAAALAATFTFLDSVASS